MSTEQGEAFESVRGSSVQPARNASKVSPGIAFGHCSWATKEGLLASVSKPQQRSPRRAASSDASIPPNDQPPSQTSSGMPHQVRRASLAGRWSPVPATARYRHADVRRDLATPRPKAPSAKRRDPSRAAESGDHAWLGSDDSWAKQSASPSTIAAPAPRCGRRSRSRANGHCRQARSADESR